MLNAYVQTFDVTENLEIFWELNMALCDREVRACR
jgi:hypothetical protein